MIDKELLRILGNHIDLASGSPRRVVVNETQDSATNGGSSVSGDNIRTLNTVKVDHGMDITLDTNKIPVTQGTIRVKASCPVSGAVGLTYLKVMNVTPTTPVELARGRAYQGLAALTQYIELDEEIEIASDCEIKIYHYTENVVADTGLGTPASVSGVDEIYSVVEVSYVSDPNSGVKYAV